MIVTVYYHTIFSDTLFTTLRVLLSKRREKLISIGSYLGNAMHGQKAWRCNARRSERGYMQEARQT